MATTQKTKVFERIVKNLKQKSTVSLKEVKCDGSPEGFNKVFAVTIENFTFFRITCGNSTLLFQKLRFKINQIVVLIFEIKFCMHYLPTKRLLNVKLVQI